MAKKGEMSDAAFSDPDWLRVLHQVETEGELESVRHAMRRGCPLGNVRWQRNTAIRLGLEFTLRPRGRPKREG
jgi:putative transposase